MNHVQSLKNNQTSDESRKTSYVIKKYLLIIFALLFLGSVDTSYAQTSCRPVTPGNYSACCGVAAGDTNSADCKAYNRGYSNPSTIDQPVITPPISDNSCEYVYSQNYNFCCKTVAGSSVNQKSCSDYDNHTVSPDYVPGTIGGGGLNTGAYNSSGTSPEYDAPSPQSSSIQLAQCSKIQFKSLLDILIWIRCIIVVAIIPLIFALAFVVFLWGVFKFIATTDSIKREEGKKFIIAGLIGLFVMVSLWGIINIVSNTLGTGSAVPILQTSSLKKTP